MIGAPELNLIMRIILLILAWRYETTANVLNKNQWVLAMGILTPFVIFIAALTGAWHAAGAAAATEIIPDWASLTGVMIGTVIGIYIMLQMTVFVGASVHGVWWLASWATKEKKKGIPQSLGDTSRLALHDDDNPFIDLRFIPPGYSYEEKDL